MEALYSITDALARQFSSLTRSRGDSYAKNGAVDIVDHISSAVRAIVSGSQDYEVLISLSGNYSDVIDVSCSCPRYNDGYLCKHLWATFRECDRRNILLKDLDLVTVQLEEWDHESLREIVDHQFLTEQEAETVARRQMPVRKPVTWQIMLQQVESEEAEHTSQRSSSAYEVYYIVNLADCLNNGALTVQLMRREQTSPRDQSAIQPLRKTLHQIETTASTEDVQMVHLLHSAGNVGASEYETRFQLYQPLQSITLHEATYQNIMPRLCESGRCLWKISAEQPMTDAKPVYWDDGEPYRFMIAGETDPISQSWILTGHLKRGEELKNLSHDIMLGYASVVLFSDGTMARSRTEPYMSWIDVFIQHSQLRIPFADRDLFLNQLYQAHNLPELQFPEELCPTIESVPPVPKLYLTAEEYNVQHFTADVKFLYGEVECEADGQSKMYLPESHTLCSRNHTLEQDFLRQLDQLNFKSNWGLHGAIRQLKRQDFANTVETLLNQGWQVNAEGCEMKNSHRRSVSICSGIDWFDLQAEFDFDGQAVELPALLKAARKGEQWVELGNGSRGLLPTEWLEKYAQTLNLGEHTETAVRFRPSQAMIIDSILASQPQVTLDRTFRNLRKKLASVSGVKPRTEPKTFKGELRDYQRDGLGWMWFLKELHFGGCLADDMGLGKTVQILAMLEERRKRRLKADEVRKPSIVIVPKSLVFNWYEEATRFSPKLNVIAYVGLERKDLREQLLTAHLIVTTYGTLRGDIEFLSEIDFDYVILDEAQAIKNATSQTAKACCALKSDYRLAATGTPIENNLNELWSLFEFLNPGMLGRSSMFKSAVKRATQDPEKLQLLSKAVAPYVLRRTKSQVLTELPEKAEQTLHCKLSKKHRNEYDQLRNHYQMQLSDTIAEKGLQKSKIHVLEALLRLRQAACHPGLIDKQRCRESSAKVDMLMEQLEEVVSGGHKALVFSQFTSLLAIVKTRMEKAGIVYEYLDGKTSKRQSRVQRFQTDDSCSAFLISLKAGGTGLNLTAADYVFILDPWWNPATEAQAIDRAHRIGQNKNVMAYRIITEGTIEEKVAELQAKKKVLADAIITTNDHLLKSLSADDLQLLLS